LGLLGHVGEELLKKILLSPWAVKREIASPRRPYFLAKIDDFHLNYCTLKENAKNMSSGRNYCLAQQYLLDQILNFTSKTAGVVR